ncbi:hypothetical protein [Marinitoga sp. 1138]|uniref:hypothetical protein n=1 Tax=Marinitoga sp. 1138 TaxID=1643334 RepID=UPI0015860334|nr:hypothetical protein [Marinitoga sp. 1138]NUU97225.1 hypothetical protein [Marinitoga sp. 1138]
MENKNIFLNSKLNISLAFIFFSMLYISYSLVLPNFISFEILGEYNIEMKKFYVINFTTFFGFNFGILLFRIILNMNKVVRRFFFTLVVLLNAFSFLAPDYDYFLFLRFLAGMGLGVFWIYVRIKTSFLSEYSKIKFYFGTLGLVLGYVFAAMINLIVVPQLGWSAGFLVLFSGFLLFPFNKYLDTNISYFDNNKECKICLNFFFFLSGFDFYILISNIKLIYFNVFSDLYLTNLHIFILTVLLLIGIKLSKYIFRFFSVFKIIITLNLLLIFFSIIGFYTSDKLLIILVTFLIFVFQSISWSFISQFESIKDDVENYLYAFHMSIFGGLFASFVSYLLYPQIERYMFVFIMIISMVFIIAFKFSLKSN